MKKNRLMRNRSVLFVGAMLAVAYAAQGADRTWSNTSGGAFEEVSNWSGGVPGTNDNALFTANASYAVTFSSTVTNGNAKFGAPGGVVTLDVGAANVYYMNTGTGLGTFQVQNTSGGAASVDLISGTVSANSHVYVGDLSTYNGNRLTVRNPGTLVQTRVWDVNVGLSGSFNELLVTNGGTVAAMRTVYAGYNTGSNNLITVTGSNSQIIAAASVVSGRNGDNNRIVVDDFATIACTNGTLSIGDLAGADYNSVAVRSGSTLTNGANNPSYVGNAGSYNALAVSNAAFRLYANLNIGLSGSFNRMDVLDGGSVSTRTHVYIGTTASSVSNTVVVSGSNSVLKTMSYDVNVGNSGHSNALLVCNGALVESYRNIYVGTVTGSYNRLEVSGLNSTLKCDGLNNPSYSMAVGYAGTNNTFRLADGAAFVCTNAVDFAIGVNSSAFGNSTVFGSGCVATNPGSVYVGKYGGCSSLTESNSAFYSGYTYIGYSSSGNSMALQDGAKHQAAGHYYMGYNAGANSNTLTVAGAGTVLTNTQFDLDVGRAGSYNLMVISNGASAVISRNAYVGHLDGASNNTLRVAGGSFQCAQPAAGSLVLSNACTLAVCGSNSVVLARALLVRGGSCLDLRLGPDGFTPIGVQGAVTFDATTRLTVDARDYQQVGGTVTLMTYGSKSGSIEAGNITVLPADATVNQNDGNRITIRVPSFRRTVISIR